MECLFRKINVKEFFMKKGFWFLAVLAMVLVFMISVIGCGDDPDNNDNSGGVYTPTSISPDSMSILINGFKRNLENSTLPGIDSTKRIFSNSCGFTITSGGNNVPINFVSLILTSIEVIPTNNLTAGQQVTISYTPNGTHIFKDNDGKTLGAFTLSATVK
jgi:hypothetical protein